MAGRAKLVAQGLAVAAVVALLGLLRSSSAARARLRRCSC
jgi:hypothetical protein